MRLKSIKLAGFKSFVDPTTVPFPSNLSAVVGPNGCGKSNIIDAVRWVMGESSAKHLRGESMTDVIFNGATTRKPVGQASIELVFDNHEGKVLGEFAQFSEISVKRRVTRDGVSDYFLNGTKCRRRDITDLFLGTGLGPRSYAIIEQGMISRLIESKPEELRIYIEEAAGISKYKERRRDTENRIRRTKENLERLADITEELDRQLAHLHKQAQTAEKYTELKAEERFKRSQLSAFNWVTLGREADSLHLRISESEVNLEKYLADRLRNEGDIEHIRTQFNEKNREFERAQATFYETGAMISRLEQSIRHAIEKRQNLAREKEENERLKVDLQRELEQEREQQIFLEEELFELEPELEESLIRAEESAEQMTGAEDTMQSWQLKWDEFNQQFSEQRNKAELSQAKIQQIEQEILRARQKIARLQNEKSGFDQQIDEESLSLNQECIEELVIKLEGLREEKEQKEKAILQLREKGRLTSTELNEVRGRVQIMQGKLGSLQALQEAALRNTNTELQSEMIAWNVGESALLAKNLQIGSGWESAAEAVLSPFMSSVIVEGLEDLISAHLSLVEVASPIRTAKYPESLGLPLLSEFVKGHLAVQGLLFGVFCAETLDEALAFRGSLEPWERIVTRDGILMGMNWLQRPDASSPESGILARLSEIERLQADMDLALKACGGLEGILEETHNELTTLETEINALTRTLADMTQQRHQLQSKMDVVRARNDQIRQRGEAHELEINELSEHAGFLSEELAILRESWQEAMANTLECADKKEALLTERDQVRARYDEIKHNSRHLKDNAHQLQLRVQGVQARRNAALQSSQRVETQMHRVIEKLNALIAMELGHEDPIEEMKTELELFLEKRVQDEEMLADIRIHKDQLDESLRDAEQGRMGIEQRVQDFRNQVQELRLQLQSVEIRRNGFRDELRAAGQDIESLQANLEDGVSRSQLEEDIEKLVVRIQRLGAINLAAIEEYKLQSERKSYLQEQADDLNEALETLENAIRKIDRETRARFKETFETVNNGLQALFPKVFGGGTAYLDLTGEDLLETGVTIMARPPGKKNSTIHLLSGGEKALTAIALIFSIFQLNPAPFCMLDEVDAPLDDANVARYANLVREMSSQVQFIYITHNKIAMEMADQLMGVTMHEPGVSRLVAVNVEEAAALASA